VDTSTADFDGSVRLHIYDRFIQDGRPPTVAEAAQALDVPAQQVEEAFLRLAQSHSIVLKPGTTDIWMANPLSAEPTPFPVQVGDRSVFGNCVWDALGVIAMLGGTGRVETRCPDCGWPLDLTVRGGELQPAEGVIHFAVPAAHWWDDIGYT
jgi:hypothetical protein